MANGKIPAHPIGLTQTSATANVPTGVSTKIAELTIPNHGRYWFVYAYLTLAFNSSAGTMNNEIRINDNAVRVTRTTQFNGGGCINCVVAEPGNKISLYCYVTNGSGNASGFIQAIKI